VATAPRSRKSCAARSIAPPSAPTTRSARTPDDRSRDRATHGAVCHGCLLIAETNCEMRNLFLDRNLLAPTMATDGSAIFER
jgi:hypothetical protein